MSHFGGVHAHLTVSLGSTGFRRLLTPKLVMFKSLLEAAAAQFLTL